MSTYSMFNQFAILTFTHLISHDLSHTHNNNNNNRFIISTIGPSTRHSLLVTISFSRLFSAFDVPYSTIFACLELQKLHTLGKILPPLLNIE